MSHTQGISIDIGFGSTKILDATFLEDWAKVIRGSRGHISIDYGNSYSNAMDYYSSETPREREKRKIDTKLQDYTDSIQGLERQAFRKIKEKQRGDRYTSSYGTNNSNAKSYISKKVIDRERDGILRAVEKLKEDKEEFYTEHLEYFI